MGHHDRKLAMTEQTTEIERVAMTLLGSELVQNAIDAYPGERLGSWMRRIITDPLYTELPPDPIGDAVRTGAWLDGKGLAPCLKNKWTRIGHAAHDLAVSIVLYRRSNRAEMFPISLAGSKLVVIHFVGASVIEFIHRSQNAVELAARECGKNQEPVKYSG